MVLELKCLESLTLAVGPQQCLLASSQCCDTGFHLALEQALRSYTAAESRTQTSQMQGLGSLEEALEALDPPGDKAKVLEVHAMAFCPPLRFDYQPHEGDEVRVSLFHPPLLPPLRTKHDFKGFRDL